MQKELSELSIELRTFCDDCGLPQQSADELLVSALINRWQQHYLKDYISRWEQEMNIDYTTGLVRNERTS